MVVYRHLSFKSIFHKKIHQEKQNLSKKTQCCHSWQRYLYKKLSEHYLKLVSDFKYIWKAYLYISIIINNFG